MSQIETRPYGPDSSPEDITALEERVKIIGNDVLIFHEVPVPSKFQLDICFTRISKLLNEKNIKYMSIKLKRNILKNSKIN